MTAGPNLDDKLATVDPWVADQIAWVSALAAEHGCQDRAESGPGRAFRLGATTVLRAHPKQSHLALGFPDTMRADVATLTGLLRDQRRTAWVNWTPDALDRDTVEDLLNRAVHDATAGLASSPEAHGSDQAPSDAPAHPDAGARDGAPVQRQGAAPASSELSAADAADLRLLLAVLRAFAEHEAVTGQQVSTKVLREAVYFHWERPRLPPGGKKSPHLLHTAAARAHRDAGHRDGLIFEHAYPVNILLRELLAAAPSTTEDLRARLNAHPERVLITKAENDALIAAGVANSTPDSDDVWSRYRAAGIDPSQIAPWTPPRR
jgi:hypothetical protein